MKDEILALSLIMNLFLVLSNDSISTDVYLHVIAKQYYMDTKRAYFRGCLEGTDYPPEWRKPKTTFNNKSPMMYCNAVKDLKDRYFLYEAQKILDKLTK